MTWGIALPRELAKKRAEELRRHRHWAVVSVFDAALERGLQARGWKAFAEEIKKKANGFTIPPGTLKYWYAGLSEPKTSELEAMAAAVGLELELLQEDETTTAMNSR